MPWWWPPAGGPRNGELFSVLGRLWSHFGRGLLVIVSGEAESDGAPEEPSPHLNREVALVVCVPYPDVAAILHHARIRGGLHAQGLECSQRRFDLFATLDLHGDGHVAHRSEE